LIGSLTEKMIENAILTYLNMRKDCFAFKFKDQSLFANGKYRKGKWEVNGVADIGCLLDNGRILWLEVKKPKAYQSKSQKEFQKRLEALGHVYYIVRSVDEVAKIMDLSVLNS